MDQFPAQGNFFQHINETYGPTTTRLLKNWTNIVEQLASATARRIFLLKCRSYDVYPSNIVNSNKRLLSTTFYSDYGRDMLKHYDSVMCNRLLKLEIKDINYHITFLTNQRKSLKIQLDNSALNETILKKFLDFTNAKKNNIHRKILKNLEKKFQSIVARNNANKPNSIDKTKWIKNLTNVPLPQDVSEIVSLGRKHALPTDIGKKEIITTIKNLEEKLEFAERSKIIDKNTSDEIRISVTQCLKSSSRSKSHITREDKDFNKKLKKTKSFIKENPSIFFTNADKGNLTVCLYRSEYNAKMNELLSDENFYKVIKKKKRRPFLRKLQLEVYRRLKKLNDGNCLKRKYLDVQLTQTDTVLARMYGLPKIHKIGNPLRPIISLRGSPTHFIAKVLYEELKPCIPPISSHIDNSFVLKEKLKNITIPEDAILLSLDVSSLFTNVPVDLVLKSLDLRFADINSRCHIPFDEIRELVKFLYDNTYFLFNNKLYHQVFGCPMGSPISPLFSDLVMADLETKCMNILESRFQCTPIFYFRYVDDTILCIKREHLPHVLEVFNNYDPHLQFTHEIENNGRINFLDLTLIRQENQIKTNWFQKPTTSGRILNFNSFHSIQQKRNIIYNLIDRATLLSDKKFHSENIKKVKDLLYDNDYPQNFIDKCTKDRIKKIRFSKEKRQDKNRDDYIFTLALPNNYKFFKKCSGFLKSQDIRTVPLVKHGLKSIVTLGKDPLSDFDTAGTVYKFVCKNRGCKKVYIGQSKRPLWIRTDEHKKDKDPDSVVTKHKNRTHQFDFGRVSILDKELNYTKRKFSEMLHIVSTDKHLNKREDVKNLSTIYKPLFKNFPE